MNIVHHIQQARIKNILYYSCLILAIDSQNLPAKAQITPDSSQGIEASQLNRNVLIHGALGDKINGGAKRGGNLFHSFSEFNIQDGQRVYFANPTGVENILARVTGGKASNIFGTLGVDGAANLFLINPNGILFGENAQLDVQGSFVGTTANGVQFGNQGNFSATNPQAPALLTVNPSALFFNQINQGAGIQNNSIAPVGIEPAGFNTFGLRVGDGKSLLLVGGNVSMNGGWLNAYSGRVELGGLTAPGNINLTLNGDNLSLKFPENVTRADVSLTNKAIISVQGFGGGNIAINARNIEILDGSGLNAGIGVSLGTPKTIAGDITLNGTGEIKIAGLESQIVNLVRPEAKGNGGNITIDSGSFLLQDGAMLSTSTFGEGNAGNVTVNAKNGVFITDAAILSAVSGKAVGNGGDININAASLSLSNGAQLLTITGSPFNTLTAVSRNPGNVNIKVTGAVDIAGGKSGLPSAIASFMGRWAFGDGGNITIDSDSLSLRDGAQLSASTFGQGNAGNIRINATNSVTVSGTNQDTGFSSGLSTSNNFYSQGRSGDIIINTKIFHVSNGALIDAGTRNNQTGGNITVNANTFAVDNQGKLNAESRLSNGGNININSDLVFLRSGAQISTSAGTEKLGGNGGNININSRFIIGFFNENSDISANAFMGKGGNIQINSQAIFGIESRLKLTPKSDITASSELGISGVKNINKPDNSSIQNSFTGLSQNAIDTNALIANSCISRGIKQQENSFTITGSGALPTNRPGVLVSRYTTGEVRGIKIASRLWKKGNPIIEAQGLHRLSNGQLILSQSC
ncbi:MAG: filamentous hemagglutinin N-terminal domain-containing protein [Nostoc sp. DedVER02]|uniref:two-partner secretion domain-containing protein n=1 Tax=unclassified Nostoc TaxID=2593658 RepID=UPI002AD3F18F|nr:MULTISPECIES: filamentous hemagglutinin N-terminal domain-containing protein [unclassified Nostoc]MDZ7985029.1 filamentous hemagglutinin N-terminal domain-containing protein [Nostoc sp. DedVER02]MDZ8114083.1 filamentous hemagglutinin N-terminal domain-containing protein [Nostoc sp. DedVER01b]